MIVSNAIDPDIRIDIIFESEKSKYYSKKYGGSISKKRIMSRLFAFRNLFLIVLQINLRVNSGDFLSLTS